MVLGSILSYSQAFSFCIVCERERIAASKEERKKGWGTMLLGTGSGLVLNINKSV